MNLLNFDVDFFHKMNTGSSFHFCPSQKEKESRLQFRISLLISNRHTWKMRFIISTLARLAMFQPTYASSNFISANCYFVANQASLSWKSGSSILPEESLSCAGTWILLLSRMKMTAFYAPICPWILLKGIWAKILCSSLVHGFQNYLRKLPGSGLTEKVVLLIISWTIFQTAISHCIWQICRSPWTKNLLKGRSLLN